MIDLTPGQAAYAGLCLLGLLLGLLLVAILYILCKEGDQEVDPSLFVQHEDDPQIEEIPEYPYPAVHVTRFGMHRDHIRRGLEKEEGCPVCYEMKVFLGTRDH